MPSRTPGWQNASQLARATGTKIGQRLVSQPVELARLGILLDLLIEVPCLKFLESCPEAHELVGRQFGHGLLDVFKCGHSSHLHCLWRQKSWAEA